MTNPSIDTVVSSLNAMDISSLSDDQLEQLQADVLFLYERIGRESMRRFYIQAQQDN